MKLMLDEFSYPASQSSCGLLPSLKVKGCV